MDMSQNCSWIRPFDSDERFRESVIQPLALPEVKRLIQRQGDTSTDPPTHFLEEASVQIPQSLLLENVQKKKKSISTGTMYLCFLFKKYIKTVKE